MLALVLTSAVTPVQVITPPATAHAACADALQNDKPTKTRVEIALNRNGGDAFMSEYFMMSKNSINGAAI